MKPFILSLALSVLWATAVVGQSSEAQHFGEPITTENALAPAEFINTVEQRGEATAKVEGEVTNVCAVKGCWMTMDVGGQEMMVRFKDYGFFVPKDAAGKTAVVQGQAKVDTVDVATLRHYAEDAGKSAEEVKAITEPEVKLSFEADGVLLRE